MSQPGYFDTHRERWVSGEVAWFEYHCWESPESDDAPAWYHSHQRVTVLRGEDGDGWAVRDETTAPERLDECGTPITYRVRFADGLEWSAFEDELLTVPEWTRPAPPVTP